MKGYLRKKKGRASYWESVVYIGRDPVTGDSRYDSRGFSARTQKAADELHAQHVVDMAKKRAVDTEGSFGHLLTRWMDHIEGQGLSESTLVGYESVVRQLRAAEVGPKKGRRALAGVPLRELDEEMLDGLYSELVKAGRKAQTVRNYHNVVKQALDTAVRWKWLERSPAADVDLPERHPYQVTTTPGAAVAIRLAVAAETSKNPDNAVAFKLLFASGARRGELCGLRWSDIDFDERSMKVEQNVVRGRKGLVVKGPKRHRTRRLTLDQATVEVLRAYREICDERARWAGTRLKKHGYVFASQPDGSEPIRPDRITQAVRRLRDRIEEAGLRTHDLRHSNATELIAAGVDVRTVAGRLGHADPSTTLRIYSAFMPAADQRAADTLGDIVRTARLAAKEASQQPEPDPA